MKKPLLIFAIGGFLVIIGITLSVYGSQLILENIATDEKHLGIGMSIKISKELDPAKNKDGVYVVQIPDFKQNHITATVFNPSGQTVVSKTIETNPFQNDFEISQFGTYELVIENIGESEMDVVGVIGYLPHDESLTVSIFGFIVIVVGLIGLVVGIIYFIKSRGSTKIS